VYSLAAMLYEVLAGRPPFQAESITALLRQIVEEEPQPPGRFTIDDLRLTSAQGDGGVNRKSKIENSVPRDLEVICLKCLAKEPSRRYESASALADDLRRWLAGEAIHARSVSTPEKLWLWARRHRGTA